MDEHSVPENIAEVYPKRLNEFIKVTLSKQKKTRDVETDRTLEKIQKRLVTIMEPISQIWVGVDSMKNSSAPNFVAHQILTFITSTKPQNKR